MTGIDLFDMASSRPPSIITAGRYRLPNLDGSPRPGGLRRASNTASAISDQRNLTLWELRMALLGLRGRVDMFEELQATRIETMEAGDVKAYLEGLAERAKDAAGSGVGAARGTLRHTVVEDHHAGLPPVVAPSTQLGQQLGSYAAELKAQRLTAVPGMQEQVIVNEAVQSAGRFDNLLSCDVTGTLYIADLKSQASFWSWLEILIQQAIYAHADAIAVVEGGRFVRYEPMPPVSRTRAIIMHMPSKGQAGQEGAAANAVHLYEIDIEQGWRFALLAHEVCEARSAGKSKRAPLGWRREAPTLCAECADADAQTSDDVGHHVQGNYCPNQGCARYRAPAVQAAFDPVTRSATLVMAPVPDDPPWQVDPVDVGLAELIAAKTPAEVRLIKERNLRAWTPELQAAAVRRMGELKALAGRA